MLVLSSVNLPYAGLAMMIGIDKIRDMVRTAVNVTGMGVCSTLVAATSDAQWARQIKEKLQ
jgi:Na+/H+-dicarboxylate symporter